MSKAKLILILKAGDEVVEETEDPILWRKVLATIQGEREQTKETQVQSNENNFSLKDDQTVDAVVEKFAASINVSPAEVRGSIDPQKEDPYITLNSKCWEAMKKQTPRRGPGAVGPAAVVGTVLALWFEVAKNNESVTQNSILKILETLGVADNNPARSVKNAEWLIHRRGGIIKIDPSQISKAESFVKKFCTKRWNDNDKTT